MSARVSSAGLTARMLRRRPGPGVLLAVLSLVLAFAATSVPIAVQLLGDRVVREGVAALAPGERDLDSRAAGLPEWGPPPNGAQTDLAVGVADVWGAFDTRLEAVRQSVPRPLKPLLAPAQYAVRSSAGRIDGRVGHDSIGYIMDPRYQQHAVLTAGEWPMASDLHIDPEQGVFVFPPVVEIALSTKTAGALEWAVGQERASHVADTLGRPGLPLKLVATFDPAPGSDDYWYHLESVITPNIRYVDLAAFTTGTAFLAPETLGSFPLSGSTTRVWYPLHTDDLSAADVPKVVAQLRSFTANAVRVGTGQLGAVQTLSFDTSTIDSLTSALDTQNAMGAVFAIVLSAPAGAAVAVLAVACRVVARSRRPWLALLAARGASGARLRGLHAWHGFWFGSLPALAVCGAVVVIVLTSAIPLPESTVAAAVIVALLPPALLAAIAPPAARLEAEVVGEPSPSRRRLRAAAEVALIVLAVLAAAALVTNAAAGARIGSVAAAPAAAGLVILMPLLAALVGCVLALRLYPLPLRALLHRRRRAAGLTGFLGAARALRESAVGIAPVLALLIGVSSATTSGVLWGSIQQEIDTASRAAAGAELQIARVQLTADILTRIAEVPGVSDIAPVGSVTRVSVFGEGTKSVLVTLLVVDPRRIGAVQDPVFPLVPDGPALEQDGAGVPVVLSALTSSQLDDPTDVRVGAGDPAAVAGVSSAPAPQGVNDTWAVVAADRLSEVTPETPDVRNAFVRFTADADPLAVERGVREIVGADATVLSSAAVRAELSSRTGTLAIEAVLLVAAGVGAVLAALSVMLSLALSAPARDRLFGLLRALGAPKGIGRGLLWWELWPSLTAALVAGTAVGLAVPALLLATVDFRVFVGAAPSYHLSAPLLSAAILGFLAVTAVFTAFALAISRRVMATAVLRQSQEG